MVAPSRTERIQLETAKQVKVDKADYNEHTDTNAAVCSNLARLTFLHNACRSLSKDDNHTLKILKYTPSMYSHILSDDENRMLFCDAPKTGSSFFKDLWLNYTRNVYGGPDVHTIGFLKKHGLRYLSTYSQSEIQTRLKTYYKFMVARHPLVRLLSAYHEKLELPNKIYQRFVGRHIEQRYGITANQSKGANVTFEQFVHYLVDTNPVSYNHHWKPVTFLCHPCEIQYDYIVKLDTSYVDYIYILSQVKNITDSKRGLINSVTSYKALTGFDRVKKYYTRVPATHMDFIERTYHLDLDLFGYTWNKTSLSYGCRVKTEGKECC
ncbi:Carbohydrate sulfotransferase 12 [Lamellibrachia satsuma]|nr:Carbohydrate sulfotransferase 12 [Lamellibrachia satsuma]